MKQFLFIFLAAISIVCLNSCSKDKNDNQTPTDLVGKWTQREVYANDSWGAPFYWQQANDGTTIEFTADGKFFKKYTTDAAYTYIGTFQRLSDSTLQITLANPGNSSHPSHILAYQFSAGGYLTLGNFASEGVIKEKYHSDQ